MEEFIFVSPDGEVYRKQFDGKKIRHGGIAYEYMKIKNLPLIEVEPDVQNGFYWGKELAKNHSVFCIQNAGDSGGIFIPSILTEQQILWVENCFGKEIEIFNGLLLVCDFIDEHMRVYDSTKYDVIRELDKSLADKGVNINMKESGELNDIRNKRRYT